MAAMSAVLFDFMCVDTFGVYVSPAYIGVGPRAVINEVRRADAQCIVSGRARCCIVW